ncbi:S8 family peptidase [Streptomyces phytophilus]|uniref:S8 family peptidase n=1 Tax=Streptomyces phytophilus TaxID=722715 RepID=UPI0015F07B5C|nr:S8 family peptidase [Streptomyces phytophilus]
MPTRVLTTALAACALPLAMLPPSEATAAAPDNPGQPAYLIAGYKPHTPQATSDQAVKDTLKSTRLSASLAFDRRLATGAVRFSLDQDTSAPSPDDLASKLAGDPDVAYAEPDPVFHPAAEPDDPRYPEQWDLWDDKAGMNVPPAWQYATGKGVNVAVIDTGYVTHSDLDNQITPGYDFISHPGNARDGNGRDPNYHDPGSWAEPGYCGPGTPAHDSVWHGTHVAGTIAAQSNNANGVTSTAYDATVQPLRALGACGGAASDIAEAVIWAAGGTITGTPDNEDPAEVINLSLGNKVPCDTTTQQAIDYATDHGTTVVVSAGNDNANADDYSPASCQNVITVAANDRTRHRAPYSNYGPAVEITAPGGSTDTREQDAILSTYNTGTTDPAQENYLFAQGTSMAAPHISALAALIRQLRPQYTPAQTTHAITSNAAGPITGCGNNCGAGLADAGATLRALTTAASTPTDH